MSEIVYTMQEIFAISAACLKNEYVRARIFNEIDSKTTYHSSK